MNHRERALRVLNHQEADRPAIDLGATVVTGTSAWTYRRLKEAMGLPCGRIRVPDLFQMLAEVEEDVLDAVDADFVMLPKEKWLLNARYGNWKPFTFWDGQTFDVSGDFNPDTMPDGSLEAWFNAEKSIRMRMPHGGWFFDFIPDPNADSLSIPHVEPKDWPMPGPLDEGFLARERERARALRQRTTRAIVAEAPFYLPSGYGPSLYQWALKMMTDPDHAHDFMMKTAEAAAGQARQYMEAVGEYIDVIGVSWGDYGQQDREVFDPGLFGQHYVPAWRAINDVVHGWPGVKTFIHCCGSVPRLMEHFIDAGVDCLNPVQWTAGGMDLKSLKEKYGERLVFWGGAISTQRTFPKGTPEDVAREAREVLDIMTPGGGFVATPIHNILPEVPSANVISLFETLRNYR
jgi:hypothetical protein